MLFHQRENQLDKKLTSALQNAQVKFIFSTDDDPKPERHFFFKSPRCPQRTKYQRPLRQVAFVPDPPHDPKGVAVHRREMLRDFLTPTEVDQRLNRPKNEKKATKENLDYEDLLR
jgi:hypothetical protein